MPYQNEWRLKGHLGKDPELTTTQNGKPVARFSIAITTKSREPGGEDRTEWFPISAYKYAYDQAKHIKKGDLVSLIGSPSSFLADDRDNPGQKKIVLTMNCFSLEHILYHKKEQAQTDFPFPDENPPAPEDLPF